jgi:hypothetical protein
MDSFLFCRSGVITDSWAVWRNFHDRCVSSTKISQTPRSAEAPAQVLGLVHAHKSRQQWPNPAAAQLRLGKRVLKISCLLSWCLKKIGIVAIFLHDISPSLWCFWLTTFLATFNNILDQVYCTYMYV